MTSQPVFRIDPSRPLSAEMTRILDETGGRVVGHLEDSNGDHGRSLHEARKGIKKLRALLLLARAADKPLMKEEGRRLRDAARLIAGPREATAAVETVDRFIAAFPGKVESCRLAQIRDSLDARHTRIAGQALDDARAEAAAMCRMALERLRGNAPFAGVADSGILAKGFARTLRHWSEALERARDRGDPDDLHELRKTVKAHGAQLGLMRDYLDASMKKRRSDVDALGELLGEINDIHVMRAGLAGGTYGLPPEIDTKPFDRLLKKHARTLSKIGLQEAGRLLASAPEKPGKRLRRRLAKAA
ncbi:MAG: CHAD domain-containing protein [Aquamicrobium sp.]|nr:CHAD domain-containing protein [Aquamicrobium sp.]